MATRCLALHIAIGTLPCTGVVPRADIAVPSLLPFRNRRTDMLRSNPFALAVLAVLLSTSGLVAGPARAADACDAVYNANIKLLQTPHHGFLTMTHSAQQMHNSDRFKQGTGKALYAGKTETSETIFDGKASYLLHHGTWMRSPVQPKDMLEDAREKLKTHPATCTLVGDQYIDGQAATLYKIHSKEANTDDQ